MRERGNPGCSVLLNHPEKQFSSAREKAQPIFQPGRCSFHIYKRNGSALLNGTLNILLQGSFNPTVGSTYKILLANAGQINGTFSSIENDIFNNGTEKWDVDYDSADGYVELIAAPVPEPGTLLVLIPGLLGAGFRLRRQLFR